MGLLIESVRAEEDALDIAAASARTIALIFGAFDYWSSLRMLDVPYRFDHPLVDAARIRIAKAAASVGIPAIAEMTLNFPTKDKSLSEQQAALDECRQDALHAKRLGFRGKWTGIPAQVDIALEVFAISDEAIARAIEEARLYRNAELAGRGAVMIRGKMADRATDRMHREVLRAAHRMGRLDDEVAVELGLV